MSCLSEAWCPQCEQVIADSPCICALVCDRHGQVCTRHVPDGKHTVRRVNPKGYANTEQEYRNGWVIGRMGWPDWDTTKDPVWVMREMGHPTQTPWDVEQGQRNEQTKRENAVRFDGVWIARGAEDRLSEGAGI